MSSRRAELCPRRLLLCVSLPNHSGRRPASTSTSTKCQTHKQEHTTAQTGKEIKCNLFCLDIQSVKYHSFLF
ncbi:hypothetical protein PBY51_019942 [Eleginops maclovinus]|uniref:Uncharacterized protein n=1 Tax=Eleginops maclovinus TaxID=56733 RepID=A0AAN8AMR9_ELEMC|nr:hypothetical protein PBY51_019942 [Eleginops maclovinus]